MDGLFLGLIGGIVISMATVIGAFFILFKDTSKNKIKFQKFKLDFFMGPLLAITSVSLIYPRSNDKNVNLGLAAFFLGVLGFILFKKVIKNFLETIVINNRKEKHAILFILLIMLKNIPVGLAAGAAMNIGHTGEGNSLLAVLAFQNFFDGAALALCFLSMGLDPLLAILGVFACGVLAIASSLVGSYSSQENLIILSLIMALSSGALMSTVMQGVFNIAKRESRKLLLGPSFVSVMVVMLIFIVWKELL